MTQRLPGPTRQRGVVLLALLLAVALMGVLALLGADVWATAVQREREAELLFTGEQYRAAIRRYYYATPAGRRRELPPALAELVEDHRFPTPVRHLRQLYPDPMTGGDWELVMSGDRIAGVRSTSDRAPIKQKNFPAAYAAFEGHTAYLEWTFIFVPPTSRRR